MSDNQATTPETILAETGPYYGRTFGDHCCIWRPSVSEKGYVQTVPPEPGVFWAREEIIDALTTLIAARHAPAAEP